MLIIVLFTLVNSLFANFRFGYMIIYCRWPMGRASLQTTTANMHSLQRNQARATIEQARMQPTDWHERPGIMMARQSQNIKKRKSHSSSHI